MKTKDKILMASLDAFSESGVAPITTNHIADILDISPGNLYYHFKSKQQIIKELYQCFSIDFIGFIDSRERKLNSAQEVWLVLNLSFQLLVKYRFIFRDSSFTNNKYPELGPTFTTVLNKTRLGVNAFCSGLNNNGLLKADEKELQFISTAVHQMFTQWVSYVDICHNGKDIKWLSENDPTRGSDPFYITQGISQLMQLLMPYLSVEFTQSFKELEQEINKLTSLAN